MNPYVRVMAFSLALLPAGAIAEEGHLGTPQQQRACRPDVLRHCRAVQGDIAIAECLQASREKLTPACRKVIEGESR